MPNWCENTLYVCGNPKDIAKFKKKVKAPGTKLSLNKTVPIPKEYEGITSPPHGKDEIEKSKELVKKYGYKDWYDWNCANWGTKWDVEASINMESEDDVEYFFLSAWSPPGEWLKKTSELFPNLEFSLHYEEPGMGFAGDIYALGRGEIFTDDECELSQEEEEEEEEEISIYE